MQMNLIQLEQFQSLFSSKNETLENEFKSASGDTDSINNSDIDDVSHSSISTSNNSTINNISARPVILNKCSFLTETIDGGENPFGSTFCYGTDQIIVEVN